MSEVDSVGIGAAGKKTKLVKKTILVRKVVQKGATATATSTSTSTSASEPTSTSTVTSHVADPSVTPTTPTAIPTPTRKTPLNGTSTPSYTSSNSSKSNVPVTPRKSIPTTARAASSIRVAPKTPTATSSSLSSPPPPAAAAAAVSSTSTRATRKVDIGGGAASSEPISTTTTTEFVIGPDGKKKKKITTTIVKKVIKKVKKPDESDVSHVKGESASEAFPLTPSSTRLAIEVETDVPTPSDANSVVATPIESEPNQKDTAVDENVQPESESIVHTEDIILIDESQQSSDTAPSTSQPHLLEDGVSLADAVPEPSFDSIDMQPISSTKVEEESKEAKRNPFTEPLPSIIQTFPNNPITTLNMNPLLESNHVTESLSAKSFDDETKEPLTTNTAPIAGAQLQSSHFFPKIRFIPSSASEEEAALLAKQARQRDHAIELQLLSERKARILAVEKARWLSVWQAEESARIMKLNARRLAEIESAATIATKRAEEEEEDRRQAAAIEAATRLTAKTPQPVKTPTTTVDVSTPPIVTSSASTVPLQPTETVIPPLIEQTTEELSKGSAEHRTAEEKRQSELTEHELEKDREKKRLEEKKILAALINDLDCLSVGTQSWKVPRARFASVKRVTLKLEKLKSVSENSKASIEASMKDGSFGISWGSKKSRPDQAIFSLNPADFQLFEGQSHGSFPKKLSSIKSKVGTNREEWSFTLKNSSRELNILNSNQTDHDRWMKFLRTIQQHR